MKVEEDCKDALGEHPDYEDDMTTIKGILET